MRFSLKTNYKFFLEVYFKYKFLYIVNLILEKRFSFPLTTFLVFKQNLQFKGKYITLKRTATLKLGYGLKFLLILSKRTT